MKFLVVVTPLSIYQYWTQAFKKAENFIGRDCIGSSSGVGGFLFRELEESKLVETDILKASPTNTY